MGQLRILIVLMWCISTISCVAQTTETIKGRTFIVHKVAAKETLYGLSVKYGVAQDTILFYNPQANNGLKIDQVLKFPKKGTEKPNVKPSTNDKELIQHTVVAGETLYALSKKYLVDIDDIIDLNPDVKLGLKAGQILRIPKNAAVQEAVIPDDISEEPITPKTEYTITPKGNCGLNTAPTEQFDIALLLPFQGGAGMNGKIAVEFYGGVKIALDSLSNMGFPIRLHVYDTRGKNDSDRVLNLMELPEMKTMDLIIGPLYSMNIRAVSDFANRHKIPLVSPFSKADHILQNNPYLIKATPSNEVLVKQTITYMKRKNPGARFILVDPGSRKDSILHLAYYNELKKIAGKDTQNFKFVKLRTGGVYGKVEAGKKNIIIFPCTKEITVKDFLTKFNRSKRESDISLVGTEDWLEFTNVEADYYENLNLHLPVTNFANPADSVNHAFVKSFQKQFKSDPSIWAFKGYAIVCYMTHAYAQYGANLASCLEQKLACTCKQNFKFTRTKSSRGLENQSIDFLIFENYTYFIDSQD